MLITSVVLFLLGAVFGLIVLLAILKNKPTPKPAVFIHGILVVIAFALVLMFAASAAGGPAPTTAIILFAIAALGGLTLFILDMSKKPIPKALAILHPIIAVAGVLSLIMFIAGM